MFLTLRDGSRRLTIAKDTWLPQSGGSHFTAGQFGQDVADQYSETTRYIHDHIGCEINLKKRESVSVCDASTNVDVPAIGRLFDLLDYEMPGHQGPKPLHVAVPEPMSLILGCPDPNKATSKCCAAPASSIAVATVQS